MSENPKYEHTLRACFVGYIVQAIINNFAPLLFLTFRSAYGIPLGQITLLVTLNFGVQLLVDLFSVRWVDRLGYRASMCLAHGLCVAGLVLLTVLPDHCASPFAGLLAAAVVYAAGGGLLEVLVSPIVEACPTRHKEQAMSLLHSFYCWGQMAVVLLSTAYFVCFGIENWKWLALLWAVVPLVNGIVFLRVPIAPLLPEGEQGYRLPQLLGMRAFWIMALLMVCAGACEQAVSQWASAFAEQGLGVSKTIGDLAGPMLFAAMMGTARALYGRYGARIPLRRFMLASGGLCLAAYLITALSPWPALSLAGCGLCGFSVGILWPGTFSLAAASLRRGGTALFALLALAGDLGCAAGPTFVGFISGAQGDSLRAGLLAAVIFPLLLLAGLRAENAISAPGKSYDTM